MKRSILLSIAVVGVLGFALSAALAAGAGRQAPGNGAGLRHPGMRLAHYLDLTADQKAEIHKILKAAHEEAQKAQGQAAKVAIWKDAFHKIVTTVLTADQQKKLAELMGNRLGHPGAGAGNRRAGQAHAAGAAAS